MGRLSPLLITVSKSATVFSSPGEKVGTRSASRELLTQFSSDINRWRYAVWQRPSPLGANTSPTRLNFNLGEKTLKKTLVILATLFVLAMAYGSVATHADDDDHVSWTKNGAPAETYITGGGWTLEQSGAANGLKSVTYCDSLGKQVPNPGTMRMEPYYFPVITGHGKHLQGYFDYRPKDIDEAPAAASSDDAGFTWTFQQKVLELTKQCPNTLNKEPDGDPETTPNPNNSDNTGTGKNPGTGDDGQGHQFVISINGHTYLYTLERAVNHIDFDDLYIHEIFPKPGLPLDGAPLLDDGPDDTLANNGIPEIALHTHGLLNPDGILGVVPGSSPMKIIYEQKILSGDITGPSAFASKNDLCNTSWSGYYANNPYGTAVNDDLTYLRLAETTDGINFTDLGVLQGLNNPHDVSITGTRWLATAGTILALGDGRFGLLYSGGGCIDGDSDAFQYVGYAESRDLMHWHVINGINNPIAHTAPYTLVVDSNGVPASVGTTVTVPSHTPVIGDAMGWFQGRIYAPSATLYNHHDVTVIFAGYHTQKPKNGLGDYRTIGRVSLHSSIRLPGDVDQEDDWDDHSGQ